MDIQNKGRLEKISKRKNYKKDDLYVSAGEKLYIIGSQDGLFPNFGRHSQNEMGGIWAHPIKLMDGFWVRLTLDDKKYWLDEAKEIIVYPNKTEFLYEVENITIIREQFVPLTEVGCFITYKFKTTNELVKALKIEFFAQTELMPAWCADELGMPDHKDEAYFDSNQQLFIANDAVNPHHVVWGSNLPISYVEVDPKVKLVEPTVGNGILTVMETHLAIHPNQEFSLQYCIAGSNKSLENALDTYKKIEHGYKALYEEKEAYYEEKLKTSQLDLPDEKLLEVFDVTKINTQWLVRDVDGIGRGIGAGLPDYPWFFGCDNGYSIPALLAMGEFELAKNTLRILKDFSEKTNGNGRIVHEISTSGFVYNPGNTQETPHFINTVWTVYEWTDDLEFLKEFYSICKKGLNWVMNEMDDDKDLLPSGYGIMEIAGLNAELIDTAVYTAEALKSVSKMARVLEEFKYSDELVELHEQAKVAIEKEFWLEKEQLYADVVATPEAVKKAFPTFRQRHDKMIGGEFNHRLAKLDRLYEAFDTYEVGVQRPWLIFKNWVILTPLEVGYTDDDRAKKILEIMSTEEFVNDYGLYIEALGRNFPMTISTAVQAVCEAVYGRTEQCVSHMHKLANCMHKEMPLSISELSPVGGCFVQEWTIYGTIWPMVRYLFGIQPSASNKKIILSPQMLKDWNQASLTNVKIGEGSLDIHFKRDGNEEIISVTMHHLDWEVVLNKTNPNQKLSVN